MSTHDKARQTRAYLLGVAELVAALEFRHRRAGMTAADELRQARAYLLGVAKPPAHALADLVAALGPDHVPAALEFRHRRAA